MIELALWRARVGCFHNKKIKHVTYKLNFLVIHTYLLSLLLASRNKHFTKIKCMPLLAFIILVITYTIFSNNNYYYNACIVFLFLTKILAACIQKPCMFNLSKLLILLSGDIELNPGPVNNYKIAHINVRSLKAPHRLDDIDGLLTPMHKFDILCLTETHLGPHVTDSEVNISQYTIYRRDRNRFGGGVVIYCHKNINSTRRLDLEADGLEMVWIEVKLGTIKCLVCSCYRPPGQSSRLVDHFLTSMHDSISAAIGEHPKSIFILGDFNDRCEDWSKPHTSSELKNNFYNLVNNLNLHQLIKDPTRGQNLLDLAITDRPDLISESGVLPPLPNLDHSTIYITLSITYHSSPAYSKVIWDYEHADYESLNNYLTNNLPNYSISEEPINSIVLNLTDCIKVGMSNFIPHKTTRIKPRDKPWFNSNIRKLYKSCYKLHKRQLKSHNPAHVLEYLNKRRQAKEAFRSAKSNYYTNLSSKIENPETTSKTFWRLVSSVFDSNHSGIPTLFENNTQITDNRDKAELLNNFFASQTHLPPSNNNLPPFNYITDARLDHITITPTAVKHILLNLNTNKAVGEDTISNKLLKNCADSLCLPLAIIFQRSIDMGIFPDTWKKAIVSAILKKLDPSSKTNYRPISLLSCISKVFEKTVFNQTYPYLITNKLLSIINSGFMKDDGAINRLLAMIEKVRKGFDDRQDSLFISLDVSKAFDGVWHQGLIFNNVALCKTMWHNRYPSKMVCQLPH